MLCYTLFVAAFLADCSLLMLALPLSAFSYALVSVKPSKAYWQVRWLGGPGGQAGEAGRLCRGCVG